MNIQDIHITKWPCIIFSDLHTDLSNIHKLRELYPDSQFISLGDITQLFQKKDEPHNRNSIQYFIDNKIPTLLSNHEQHILGVESNANFILYLDNHNSIESGYGLEKHHVEFLSKLPIGFRLILPDESSYLLFHHAPKDLWGFYDKGKLSEKEFKLAYPIDNSVRAVIHGHTHLNFIDEYTNVRTKRISIGQLCNNDHHTDKKNGGNYLLLTENGLEYKKL